MKFKIKQGSVTILALLMLLLTACEQEFTNPNNPTEDVVFGSKEGLYALSIGLNQYYSTTVLRQVIEAPGISTRELGVTNTYLNINELAVGGDALPAESGGITNPWVVLLRAKGMAESLITGIPQVTLTDGTKSGLTAYANLYKAMCLGGLIGMFEQTVINNSPDGDAAFSDRATVLAEIITLLTEAKDALAANAVSDDFQNIVLGADINLAKTVNALLARYSLIAGSYAAAITHADAVISDASTPANSVFNYDANNSNPIWDRTVNSADLDPQLNFGLVAPYLPDAADGRIAFYLGDSTITANADAGGQQLAAMLGFFASQTTSIPLYLDGEMLLIKAEANARLSNLTDAVTNLNLVLQKTDDVFGVNAGLSAWAGEASSQTDILEEIYKNRCIELFLTGQRLEASRRFHPDLDPNINSTTNERNRNYYPYPSIERDNNPNTPADPDI